MAKSATIGDYIIEIDNSKKVTVYRAAVHEPCDNTKGALRYSN